VAAIEIVIVLIVAASVALAVIASMGVFRAKEPPGRTVAQLLFTWLVPILGPLVTIQMHRREPERHRLAEADDPGVVPGNISHRSAASRGRGERAESEPTPEPD
jgi:hypothetical protein